MKKIRIITIILFICFLFLFSKKTDIRITKQHYNWNNGYCEIDGGRLNYKSVGSKYHYECEICHKDYTFDSVMTRRK